MVASRARVPKELGRVVRIKLSLARNLDGYRAVQFFVPRLPHGPECTNADLFE